MAKISPVGYGDLALIPVPPKAGYVESLMWQTDITQSWDGTEDQICIRSQPRQTFRADYQSSVALNQHFFNTVYGGLAQFWAVPVWSEGQYAGTLAAASTGAGVGAAAADLRAGGLALAYGRGGAYAAMVLASASDSAITFPALAEEIRNAYIFPMRKGVVVGSPSKRIGTLYPTWTLEYEVLDNIEFEPDAPDQFLGNDIYFTENLYEGETSSGKLQSGVQRVDSNIGNIYQVSPWLNLKATMPYHTITTTPEEAWEFRMWLHRRRGRYRPFWYPSFENDLRLAAGGSLLTDTLTVKNDEYYNYARSRTHIAIETMDGTWYARTIETAIVVGENVELGLASSLGGLDPNAIKRISYLGLKRLDNDRIDLRWIGNGVMESIVSLLEITP